MIEGGRITYAEVKPGDSLVQRLMRELSIDSGVISDLSSLARREAGLWSLETLMLESGLVSYSDFREVARDFIQEVVGKLVRLEKGTFGISLTQAEEIDELEEIRLSDGLDIAEILLGSAKTMDESTWPRESLYSDSLTGLASDKSTILEWNNESINIQEEGIGSSGLNGLNEQNISRNWMMVEEKGTRVNLCSVLAELRAQIYEAEISLLVMRYASQIASRGILLCVENGEIRGLGQFGVISTTEGGNPDRCVRQIKFSVEQSKLLLNVIETQRPFIGQVNGDMFCAALLNEVGGGGGSDDLSMFLAPIYYEDSSLLMIYGDNFPGTSDFQGLEELLVFIEQAGLAVEKLGLERQVKRFQQENPT